MSTRPTIEIYSAPATTTLMEILLSRRTKAVIINITQSDIENLQWQYQKHQGFTREWSHYNQYIEANITSPHFVYLFMQKITRKNAR